MDYIKQPENSPEDMTTILPIYMKPLVKYLGKNPIMGRYHSIEADIVSIYLVKKSNMMNTEALGLALTVGNDLLKEDLSPSARKNLEQILVLAKPVMIKAITSEL